MEMAIVFPEDATKLFIDKLTRSYTYIYKHTYSSGIASFCFLDSISTIYSPWGELPSTKEQFFGYAGRCLSW